MKSRHHNQLSKVSFKTKSAEGASLDLVKRRKSVTFPLQNRADSIHPYPPAASNVKSGRKPIFPAVGQLRTALIGEKHNFKNISNEVHRACELPLKEGISGISYKESSDKSKSSELLPTISGMHLHAL